MRKIILMMSVSLVNGRALYELMAAFCLLRYQGGE